MQVPYPVYNSWDEIKHDRWGIQILAWIVRYVKALYHWVLWSVCSVSIVVICNLYRDISDHHMRMLIKPDSHGTSITWAHPVICNN